MTDDENVPQQADNPSWEPDGPVAQAVPAAHVDAVGPMPTAAMVEHLVGTKPWVRLMAVVTFASAGLMVLAGVGVMAAAVIMPSVSGPGEAVTMVLAGVFYMFMSLFYVPAGLYLTRFANAARRLQIGAGSPVEAVEEALKQQRRFWRYVGILTIVGFGMAILVLVIAVFAAVVAGVVAARR